jgi:predicted SprT family Zn-dependent metalloprotease
MAHIIAFRKYGNVGLSHGNEWSNCVRAVNEEPHEHYLREEERKVRTLVACKCTQTYLNKEELSQLNQSIFVCLKCNQPVRVVLSGNKLNENS